MILFWFARKYDAIVFQFIYGYSMKTVGFCVCSVWYYSTDVRSKTSRLIFTWNYLLHNHLTDEEKTRSTEMWFPWMVLIFPWMKRATNEEVLKIMERKRVNLIIRKSQWDSSLYAFWKRRSQTIWCSQGISRTRLKGKTAG